MHGIGSGAVRASEMSRHCGPKHQAHGSVWNGLWEGHADLVIVHRSVSLCTAVIQGVEGDMGPQRVMLGQDHNG